MLENLLNYRVILLLSISICMSCDGDGDECRAFYDNYNGEAQYLLNGSIINSHVKIKNAISDSSSINISLDYFDERKVSQDGLLFRLIPNELGKHILVKSERGMVNANESIYSIPIDGDIVGNLYDLNEFDDIEDFVIISSIEGGVVEGTFQSSYLVDSTSNFNPNAPDTLHLLNGTFRGRIFE